MKAKSKNDEFLFYPTNIPIIFILPLYKLETAINSHIGEAVNEMFGSFASKGTKTVIKSSFFSQTVFMLCLELNHTFQYS